MSNDIKGSRIKYSQLNPMICTLVNDRINYLTAAKWKDNQIVFQSAMFFGQSETHVLMVYIKFHVSSEYFGYSINKYTLILFIYLSMISLLY